MYKTYTKFLYHTIFLCKKKHKFTYLFLFIKDVHCLDSIKKINLYIFILFNIIHL